MTDAAGERLAARPLSRTELDEFAERAVASFRGDQAAYEAVQTLRELADLYKLA